MKAVPFREVAAQDWDRLCDASSAAWLFHRADWIRIETQYFGGEDLSFALTDGGEVVGVQPLYLAEIHTSMCQERLLHCGVHRHTGLALSPKLGAGAVKDAQSAAMRRIMEVASERQADRIQLNSHNLAPGNLDADREEIPFWVEKFGFQLGLNFGSAGMMPVPGMATCNSDQIISLAADDDSLFARLDQKSARWAVRKAQSFALELQAGADPRGVDEYYRIAQLSAQRTGEGLAPKAYYEDIWKTFSDAGRCAVLFAKRESALVAALFLLIDKGGASYLGGVSDPDSMHMYVNDFLHWSAILWAKRAGLSHYRLGPWFPTVDKEWPISKVSRFKKKFGGRACSIIQGSYFLHPERYLANGQNLLPELCAAREKHAPVADG